MDSQRKLEPFPYLKCVYSLKIDESIDVQI